MPRSCRMGKPPRRMFLARSDPQLQVRPGSAGAEEYLRLGARPSRGAPQVGKVTAHCIVANNYLPTLHYTISDSRKSLRRAVLPRGIEWVRASVIPYQRRKTSRQDYTSADMAISGIALTLCSTPHQIVSGQNLIQAVSLLQGSVPKHHTIAIHPFGVFLSHARSLRPSFSPHHTRLRSA